MKKELVSQSHKNFEDYTHTNENGIEFWYARELQILLDYAKWDTFKNVIEKAKTACKNSNIEPLDVFSTSGKHPKCCNLTGQINNYELIDKEQVFGEIMYYKLTHKRIEK